MGWLLRIHTVTEDVLGPRMYRLLRYLMSGTAAAASNLAIVFILVHFGRVYYLHASVIAFVLSMVVSFSLQKFWTFQDKPIYDVQPQFVRYSMVVFCNLILNTVVMYLLIEKIGLWYLFAQVLATGTVAVVGYFAYQHFVFRERVPAV
ncbi:MAG: GtrA family protein [Patescibacteria group bacterium]